MMWKPGGQENAPALRGSQWRRWLWAGALGGLLGLVALGVALEVLLACAVDDFASIAPGAGRVSVNALQQSSVDPESDLDLGCLGGHAQIFAQAGQVCNTHLHCTLIAYTIAYTAKSESRWFGRVQAGANLGDGIMYHGLVKGTLPTAQWELVKEDIRHPSDGHRCDLIRNRQTGIYCTTDGLSVRSIDPREVGRILAKDGTSC